MNEEDIKKIVDIMSTADGGCSYCFMSLCAQFIHVFPEYEGMVFKYYEDNVREKECYYMSGDALEDRIRLRVAQLEEEIL